MNVSDEGPPVGVRADPAQAPPGGGSASLSQRVRALRLPSQQPPAGSGTAWIAWGLCILFAGSTAVLGYLWAWQGPKASQPEAADPQQGPSQLASEALPAGEGQIALHVKGYVIPAQQITVTPQVSGRIVWSDILEGKQVRAGQVLAELEKDDYLADKQAAEAALEAAMHRLEELRQALPEEQLQAQKELEEAQAQLKQLEEAHKRNLKLKELGGQQSPYVSDHDLEESESRYRAMQRRVERLESVVKLMTDGTRQKRIEAAEADVRRAKAELQKAQWRLDCCTIRAPVDGIILRKNAEVWNVVNPVAFSGSFNVCEIADLTRLEVEVKVQERDLKKVFTGQRCTVYAEAYPERKYEGVARLMPIADRAQGAVPVRVGVEVPRAEEGVYLKPEMGAMVIFWNQKAGPSALTAPQGPAKAEAASSQAAPGSSPR